MADPKHLEMLKRSVRAWNHWRSKNNSIRPDLSEANLRDADLRKANLRKANLRGVDLYKANLSGANLRDANLMQANLSGANLNGVDLRFACLRGAHLDGADLTHAVLINIDLYGADLTGASIYGISAWDLSPEDAIQKNLVIQRSQIDVRITVDDLEIAQFIYLLLNRRKLRNVITTLGEKAVLILGRFTERKELLDSMANKLRELDYLPIIFDFERPTDRDLTETVKVLAGLSRFVIADITNPRSVPLELQATILSITGSLA